MDHELKQRLIGAVVVTALCAIFIPMLFDDPVDNSGQVVSELSIPAPQGEESAGKVPNNADQVLKLPDQEPLSTETMGDAIESTGVAEEIIEEPDASQSKQGRAGESLYAESEGYTQEDISAEEPVDEAENNQLKSHPKQPVHSASAEAVDDIHKSIVPKAPIRDTRTDASARKIAETLKPATARDGGNVAIDTTARMQELEQRREPIRPTVKVKRPENEPPIITEPSRQITPKQPSTAKSLAAAVAEAKNPTVAAKASPKLVRWYIQLGSFSKKENAMSLWDSLHEQGVPASLDTIQTDKGISYRLRVGPELDGKKAAAMKSRLDKQNITAILVSE